MQGPPASPERKLQDAVDEILSIPRPEDWFPTVARVIRRVVACDSVTWAMLGLCKGRPSANAGVDLPDFDSRALVPEFIETYHEHPITPERIQANLDRRVLFTSDFVTLPALRETRLYRDVFRKLDIHYQGRVLLRSDAHALIGLGVNRSAGPFGERERMKLTRLQTVLRQSYHWAEGRAEGDALLLEAGAARVVVDAAGKILGTSGPADALLRLGFPQWPAHAESLPDDLRPWVAELHAHVSARSFTGRPPARSRVVESDRGRLSLRWHPRGLFGHSDLTLRFEAAGPAGPLLRRLQDRWAAEIGGSPAGRVVETFCWLARGLSNERIASRMGITVHTVKTNLAKVYGPLGDQGLIEPGLVEDEKRARAAEVGRRWLAPDGPPFLLL